MELLFVPRDKYDPIFAFAEEAAQFFAGYPDRKHLMNEDETMLAVRRAQGFYIVAIGNALGVFTDWLEE